MKNIGLQAGVKIGIGTVLLGSIIWGYSQIPQNMIEYTFLSNLVESIVLICSGILLAKRKSIPTIIDLCMVILALIMFGICISNYSLFRFDGAFLFLHIINPILIFMHWIVITEKGKIASPTHVFAVSFLPSIYIAFLFFYGHITGDYIYHVFDINALGTLRVAIFTLTVFVFFLGVAFILYFIDKVIGKKYSNC